MQYSKGNNIAFYGAGTKYELENNVFVLSISISRPFLFSRAKKWHTVIARDLSGCVLVRYFILETNVRFCRRVFPSSKSVLKNHHFLFSKSENRQNLIIMIYWNINFQIKQKNQSQSVGQFLNFISLNFNQSKLTF